MIVFKGKSVYCLRTITAILMRDKLLLSTVFVRPVDILDFGSLPPPHPEAHLALGSWPSFQEGVGALAESSDEINICVSLSLCKTVYGHSKYC